MNKIYDVFGMGNALVDMEFEVSNEFLQKNEISKGEMTLIDDLRLSQLKDALPSSAKRHGGGSAANTIVALSQLGSKCYYSCKVADDEEGRFFYQDLINRKIETNLSNGVATGITGKCLVFVTPDAERTMNTYLGITANYSEKELNLSELQKAKMLYIEGYLVTNPEAVKAVKKATKHAKDNGSKVALTFSDPSMARFFRDGLKEFVDLGIDILFCNEEEAKLFCDTDDLENAIEILKSKVKTFAVTCGKSGAVTYDGQKIEKAQSPIVTAVDTNGAGDLFAGAFLDGLRRGLTYKECASFACQLSSVLVTQFGSRLKDEQINQYKNYKF